MIDAPLNACRCGFNGTGYHPCHAKNYTCKKPAKHRLYNVSLTSLAGMQMKVAAYDTFACDNCWDTYSKTP